MDNKTIGQNISFQHSLRVGKKMEVEVGSKLTELGFTVKDISMEQMPTGHYSPFDLLAVKGEGVYVIDVKVTNWTYHIRFEDTKDIKELT